MMNNLKDFQKYINEYNDKGIDEFDGLSPKEMYMLFYSENYNDTIIKLNPNQKPIDDIPLVKQIRFLMKKIDEEKGLKLTKAGYIPPKIIKDMYNQKYIQDKMIELKLTKLTKESDSETIILIRFLCELAGLVRKKQKVLYITKRGKEVINTNNLFPLLLTTFGRKFNWAYFDMYKNESIGREGYNYSIYLVNKYGDIEREDTFYAEKYFLAFPDLKTERSYNGSYDSSYHCYSIRTFDRFLYYFGFISINEKGLMTKYVQKTELSNKYIKI
jgi:hypothetical protein